MTEEKRQLLLNGFSDDISDYVPGYMYETFKSLWRLILDERELSEYELEIAELIILEGYRLKGECNVQD